jgi:hypothetical protein
MKRERTARGHIKMAINLYKKEATAFGAYRDAVTDILHLLRADKTAQKNLHSRFGKPDYFHVCSEGWDVFLEECVNAEIEIIDKAARKNQLPLLINHKWEFAEAVEYYKELMKKL